MVSENISAIRFDDVCGKRLLVALSGGADSVALLHLLLQRRDADMLCITAAHFNHNIRGDAADADADFCRQICAAWQVELIEGSADIPSIAKSRGIGLETAAREERYRFLNEAKAQCGAELIALAHHLDDQAETVLMHLLRGTGPEGICGMQRLANGLYRPLLDVPKAELTAYLSARGVPWREDATNAEDNTPRNALRLNVLPAIEKCYTRPAQAIARYAHAAQIESAYLARQTSLFLKTCLESGPYGRRLLLEDMPDEAILRRAIRQICGSALTADKLEEIAALCLKRRGRLQVFKHLFAEKTPGALYFLPKSAQKTAPVPLNEDGATVLAGIAEILAGPGRHEICPDDPTTEVLDADRIAGCCLRTRKDGDRFHPLGAPGDRLLSDYLTDRGIDRPLRDFLPVLAKENRILWIGGIAISETARLREDTRRFIHLRIKHITNEQAEVTTW